MSDKMVDDIQIAAAVTAAVHAIRKVIGQGTNRQWSLISFSLLSHVMRIVLLDEANRDVNRQGFEDKLAQLWNDMKVKETVQ